MLQHVSSRVSGFPVASPCLWGKLQNLSCFKVPKQVVTWFCVAGVALRDIVMCLQRVELHFVWQAQYFCVLPTTLYTPLHSTLHTLHSTLHTPHTTLPALHFTLCTPHFTHSTLHSTPYTSHFTLHTPHFTLHTPHSTLHTLHFTLYTPHSTLYTLHSTLYTPHFALPTWKFTLHTPHFSHYTPHYTLHTLHSTLFRIPQSSGTVTGKNVQDCSNMFSQKCCTWLHSGSWVASCFKKHSVKIGICHPPWNIL